MNIPSPRPSKRARIEIIPLIDIIFFLLATFVLVSLSMVQNHGIPLRLPASSSAAAQDLAGAATISVSENGLVYVDKEEITIAQLPDRLRALQAGHGSELKLFINGDENARLGLAITVLDEARKLGISKVSFNTRCPAKP